MSFKSGWLASAFSEQYFAAEKAKVEFSRLLPSTHRRETGAFMAWKRKISGGTLATIGYPALAALLVERRFREYSARAGLCLAGELLLQTGVCGEFDHRLLADERARPCAPAQGRTADIFGKTAAGLAPGIVDGRDCLAGLHRRHRRPG